MIRAQIGATGNIKVSEAVGHLVLLCFTHGRLQSSTPSRPGLVNGNGDAHPKTPKVEWDEGSLLNQAIRGALILYPFAGLSRLTLSWCRERPALISSI